MSDIDTVNQFNQVIGFLPEVESFISVVQSGRVTINTDGQGNYWASVAQYSPDTGAALSNAIIPLNIVSGLSNATTALSSLLTLVEAATVTTPPPGAIP